MPLKFDLAQEPPLILALACGICLTSDINKLMACSAALTVFPWGAVITVILALVAASTSTLSTPTPALPISFNLAAFFITELLTLVMLRISIASYSAIIFKSSKGVRLVCTST